MSITKSVAVLAVPFLIEEGKIASLDAPLSTWFPEWKEGLKAKVTLRHVLTHTSGLENDPKAHTLNAAKDGVRFARESPVTVEPGTVFSYNNRAVALLAGIVKEASGEPIDQYLEKRLFAPLGIRAQWHKDPAGNVRTYADLRMGARDLAKIGQLMLDGGKPLPEGWAAKLTEPSALEKSCGLLWWILYDEKGERIGFHANGDLGQILAVYPKSRVVGVRLRDPPPSADPTEERFFSFGRFYGFLAKLPR
jgi:CubicO group peptidase (beta-lactamase class C family)